jgi:hypothetical protein
VIEQWRPVVGHEATHEVSDLGNVRSLDRVVIYSDGRRRFYRGQPLRPQRGDAVGHTIVNLGPGLKRYVHHLVLEAFEGPCPPDHEALHGPGGVADNAWSNLRYGTRSDNARDRTRDGTDRNRAKDRDPAGHLLAEPNITAWARERGHRTCLACARARAYVQQHPEVDVRTEADRYYAAIMGPPAAVIAR